METWLTQTKSIIIDSNIFDEKYIVDIVINYLKPSTKIYTTEHGKCIIKAYDYQTNKHLKDYPSKGIISCMILNPDNHILYSNYVGLITKLDLTTGQSVSAEPDPLLQPIFVMKELPSDFVVGFRHNGPVQFWDVYTLELMSTEDTIFKNVVFTEVINNQLWTLDSKGFFGIWDINELELIEHFEIQPYDVFEISDITTATLSYDKSCIIFYESRYDFIYWYDIETRHIFKKMWHSSNIIKIIALNSNQLFIQNTNADMEIIDIDTKEKTNIEDSFRKFGSSTLTPDGQILAVDDYINKFNSETNQFEPIIEVDELSRLVIG